MKTSLIIATVLVAISEVWGLVDASAKPHTVKSISLLGSAEKLTWEQTTEGLKPAALPTLHSICFQSTFEDKI